MIHDKGLRSSFFAPSFNFLLPSTHLVTHATALPMNRASLSPEDKAANTPLRSSFSRKKQSTVSKTHHSNINTKLRSNCRPSNTPIINLLRQSPTNGTANLDLQIPLQEPEPMNPTLRIQKMPTWLHDPRLASPLVKYLETDIAFL